MVAPADLFTLPTRAEIKATWIAICQSPPVQLLVTAWVPGDPTERWLEIGTRALDQLLSNVMVQAVKGFFFEYSTDPGDAGDLSQDQTPRPGWLSAFGSGWWGPERGQQAYAAGDLTVTNVGATPAIFAPYALTFRRSTPGPDGGYPTYRNVADAGLYTGAGGTLTLSPGATITIPIQAEDIGTKGNAAPAQITTVVTQTYGALSCTNLLPLVGQEREDRELYIARCRLQAVAASPNGPADAYRYACTTTTAVDPDTKQFLGSPLQLWDGSGPTTVNRVYVSTDSATTDVTIYIANPTGPATTVEVSSANGNIWGIPIIAPDGIVYNPDPIGVVPDIATLGPEVSDPVTLAPGPSAAVAVNVGPIKAHTKIQLRKGETVAGLISAAQSAIATAEYAFFSTYPIGGKDVSAGTGYLYPRDIEDVLSRAYPPVGADGLAVTPRLYNVSLSSPAASVALTVGRVAVYVPPPVIVSAANNGVGLIRLTVSDATALTTGTQVQIYDAVTTGGLAINAIWTVTNISATQVDLQSSTFPGGAAFVSGSLSTIIVQVVP